MRSAFKGTVLPSEFMSFIKLCAIYVLNKNCLYVLQGRRYIYENFAQMSELKDSKLLLLMFLL